MRRWCRVWLGGLASVVLVAGCSASDPRPPAEDRLGDASTTTVYVARDALGAVHHISATVTAPASVAADPGARAEWFLTEFGGVVGVADPATDVRQTTVIRGTPGAPDADDAVVRYERVVRGVPVLGAEIVIEVDSDGVIYSVMVTLPEDLAVDTTPSISPGEAETAVLAATGAASASSATLYILNVGLFLGGRTPSQLVWEVDTDDAGGGATAHFVDAHDGALLTFALPVSVFANVQDRSVYRSGSCDPAATVRVYTEAGLVAGATPVADDTKAYDAAAVVWGFFNAVGGDSCRRCGRTIEILTQWAVRSGASCMGAANAQWNPRTQRLYFGGRHVSVDLFAHEYTHSVASLGGVGQAGALNEAFADAFATFIDTGTRWTIADGTRTGPWRDLATAVDVGSYQPCGSGSSCPSGDICGSETCSAPPSWDNDQYGVHANANIIGHAAYLMMEPGASAQPLAFTKAHHIYYRALTMSLGRASKFVDARRALQNAARHFASNSMHGITYQDCGSVLNAFAAVGIGAVDTDSDCADDTEDNCPTSYNPDQAPGSCTPMCEDVRASCDAARTCCMGLTCLIGTCVDCSGAGGVGDVCDPYTAGSCCSGLACNPATSQTDLRCCLRNGDGCSADPECCGNMRCTLGRCACLAVGQACLNTVECCGLAGCVGGTCM